MSIPLAVPHKGKQASRGRRQGRQRSGKGNKSEKELGAERKETGLSISNGVRELWEAN